MDEPTLRYYARSANEIADRYESARLRMESTLRRAFAEGMRVLDVGAGSGRDMSLLQGMGCEVYGVEPCDQLREVALSRHPELLGRLESGALPALGRPFGGDFDGVLCSAVLMHLPRAEVIGAAIAIRSVLRESGRLLLSVPLDRPGVDGAERDEHGRLFTKFAPDHLALLFERVGFTLLDEWHSDDSLSRPGHAWCTLLFRSHHPGGYRALDQIEGILTRDRKTATYKLALFRALGEIATTSFEAARWIGDAIVGVPVQAVCEKWLYYYWPIFESSLFVPQIRGEAPGCRMPVAFRASLTQLIQRYRRDGGFTRFVLDYRGRILRAEDAALLRRVLRDIRDTIVKGPVNYAGGSLESGPVFSYDASEQLIRMGAAVWRELSLVGHWIQDAVILRWAELTSEISRGELRPSEVVDLLLTMPIPERDVADARRAYGEAHVAECTWTGRRIRGIFGVDHVVPFSLWHNNDLWNLMPTHPAVNAAKSDKLPTRELVLARRDRIIGYWEVLRAVRRERFDHEACWIAGVSRLEGDWRGLLFRCVADAVEFTASQRGSGRWQP